MDLDTNLSWITSEILLDKNIYIYFRMQVMNNLN